MILDTLAEAFQGEYDVDGSHTAYALQAKEALIEQDEDIDLESAKRYRWSTKNHGSCGESSG